VRADLHHASSLRAGQAAGGEAARWDPCGSAAGGGVFEKRICASPPGGSRSNQTPGLHAIGAADGDAARARSIDLGELALGHGGASGARWRQEAGGTVKTDSPRPHRHSAPLFMRGRLQV